MKREHTLEKKYKKQKNKARVENSIPRRPGTCIMRLSKAQGKAERRRDAKRPPMVEEEGVLKGVYYLKRRRVKESSNTMPQSKYLLITTFEDQLVR